VQYIVTCADGMYS